jgi:hypothetical protein
VGLGLQELDPLPLEDCVCVPVPVGLGEGETDKLILPLTDVVGETLPLALEEADGEVVTVTELV